MKPATQWVLDRLACALEPELRENVMGDLEELRLPEWRAACELLGCFIRRQALRWRTWRPWLALVGIVGPIGLLLTRISGGLVSGLALQALVYWQYGVPYSNNGLTNAQELVTLICLSFAVICWSWLGGYALRSLSGHATCVNGSLFYLVWLLVGPFGGLIYLLARLLLHALNVRSLTIPPRGFTSLEFTAFAVLPVIVEAILILLPSFVGMGQARLRGLPRIYLTISLVAAVATLTALLTWIEGWQQSALAKWSRGTWRLEALPWQQRLVPLLVLSWPAMYLLVEMLCSPAPPQASRPTD